MTRRYSEELGSARGRLPSSPFFGNRLSLNSIGRVRLRSFRGIPVSSGGAVWISPTWNKCAFILRMSMNVIGREMAAAARDQKPNDGWYFPALQPEILYGSASPQARPISSGGIIVARAAIPPTRSSQRYARWSPRSIPSSRLTRSVPWKTSCRLLRHRAGL